MIACVPRIYPDELFYSYLARCYVYNAYLRFADFAEDWLDRGRNRVSVEFIGTLSVQAKEKLGKYISESEILHKHTLFDYYLAFYDRKTRKMAEDGFLNRGLKPMIPIPMRHDEGYAFKYCPLCVQKDRQVRGEAYWHVEHQIPKICCCLHHHLKLQSSDSFTKEELHRQPISAEYAIPEHSDILPAYPEQREVCSYMIRTVRSAAKTDWSDFCSLCLKGLEAYPADVIYEQLSRFYSGRREFQIPGFSDFSSILNGNRQCTADVCLLLFAQKQCQEQISGIRRT